MAQFEISATTQRLLWSVLPVVAGFVAAVVLSLLVPRVATILLEVRAALLRGRDVLLARSREYLRVQSKDFWAARANEPRAPVVAELQRVSRAVEQIGAPQVAALSAMERRLDKNIRVLRNASPPTEMHDVSERERLVRTVSGGSLAGILFGVLIAVVVGAINSFLLGVFFREALPSYRLLPYPLPDVQLGHVLAVLFFVMEIAMGWAIYRNARLHVQGDVEHGTATAIVFSAIPWFMLVALGMVEIFAYSVLSMRVDMPRRLGLDAGSAVFGIAKYFLAFFGACITALLAYLGHAIADSIDRYRRSRLDRAIVRTLQQGKQSTLVYAERLRQTVTAIAQTASTMPASLVTDFGRAIGTSPAEQGVLSAIRTSVVSAMAAADPERAAALVLPGAPMPARQPVRTTPQVMADLLVHALILAVLAALCWLTVIELVSFSAVLVPPVGRTVTWTAAIALTSTIVMLGLLARSALRSLRYGSPATGAIPAPRGRVVLGSLLVGVLVVVALLMAGVAVRAGPLTPVLNAPLGVIQVGAIALLATTLDVGLIAAGCLAYLVWLSALRVTAEALALTALVAAGLVYALTVALRLAAVPGDVIRGWRAPVPTT